MQKQRHVSENAIQERSRWLARGRIAAMVAIALAIAYIAPSAIYAHEDPTIEMPRVMMPPPPRRAYDPGLPLPQEMKDQLALMAHYRRIIEYYQILSKTQRPSGRGMGDGPIVKGIEMIDNWERMAGETAARLQRRHADKQALLEALTKSFRAARMQMDLEIRKHCDHLGIPVARMSEGKLVADRHALFLKGLDGQQTAAFVVLECEEDASGVVKLTLAQNDIPSEPVACRLIGGGLIPLSIDFVMGDISQNAMIQLAIHPVRDTDSHVLRLALPLKTEGIPPAHLNVRIIDAQTSRELAARVEVIDALKNFQAPIGARRTKAPEPMFGPDWNSNIRYPGKDFFYTAGSFEMDLPPGQTSIRVLRGFEYLESEQKVDLESESKDIVIRLKRWINMPALGWRAGQTHMHSQHLMPVNDWSDWHLVPEAEGLDISFLSLFQQHEEIFTDEYPIGPLPHRSTPDLVLAVGEEFRHFSLGHMTFVGLKEAIHPISTGMLGGRGWPEGPSNGQAIDEAHAQDAVAGYCHINTMRGFISCLELPIDAALGKVDYGEVMGAGGGYKYYYPLLNCGVRMGVTGGPDWRLEDCCRVYVDLGGRKFTERNWLDGLRAHHSFVTNGPMLFLKVNGKKPGDTVSGKKAASLEIDVEALSAYPLSNLEILFNGNVISALEATTRTATNALASPAPSVAASPSTTLRIQARYAPKSSGWIAARCFGQGNAHTSPVYIELNDELWENVEDAKLLLGFAEDTLRWAQRARYRSEKEKQETVDMYRKGVDFYKRILRQSERIEVR